MASFNLGPAVYVLLGGLFAIPTIGAGAVNMAASRTIPQLSRVSLLAAFTFGAIQSGAARFAYYSTTSQHSRNEWRNLMICHASVGAALGCLLLSASRTGALAFTPSSVGILTFTGVAYAAAMRKLAPDFI